MISKYEKGESLPTITVLLKFKKQLYVSLSYFFIPNKIELGILNFRKKSSLSSRKQDSLEQLIKLKLENYLEIEDLLQIDYSFKNSIANEKVNSLEDIEKIIITIRNDWEIGLDPNNIIQLLEDNEIKVVELYDVEKTFDGLATFVNNKFPVIVVNGNFPVERKRFTLLHELGHLLLNFPECGKKMEENYCNRFASEFLFSRKLVIKEFGVKRDSITKNELIEAQKKYGISIPAIIFRLVDAGIISKDRQEKFYKKINSKPAIKEEINLSRFQTLEKSNRFDQLVYRALSQEIISTSKASSLLNKDINSLIENSLL